MTIDVGYHNTVLAKVVSDKCERGNITTRKSNVARNTSEQVLTRCSHGCICRFLESGNNLSFFWLILTPPVDKTDTSNHASCCKDHDRHIFDTIILFKRSGLQDA